MIEKRETSNKICIGKLFIGSLLGFLLARAGKIDDLILLILQRAALALGNGGGHRQYFRCERLLCSVAEGVIS